MADQGVKLFKVWGSPYSRRVEIALTLKGVKYEGVDENLSNKSPDLVKYNPVHKKIPVLLHNGKPICESLFIVEYIDETWKSGIPILPSDPYGKAMARFWAKFIDDKILPAVYKARGSQGDEKEKAIEEVVEHLKTLERELDGKKFFGGENIGLVDIAANFIALWVQVFQEMVGVQVLTKEKLPKLSEWADEYLNHSVIKQSLPPKAELAAVFRARFQPAK